MAKFNRYSKIQQPSIINPISFEEFSRVPMAKARADAAALSATQGIDTDFEVDQKDLAGVTAATKAIDGEKNSLVENILNSGVTNQTINDFIRVKKLRDDKYKTFIDQAQRNKKSIDSWKATLNSMAARGMDPRHIDMIKKKEYADKWQGTLDEEGGVRDFEPSFGAKYVNVDNDIQQTMSKAKLSAEEIQEHGYKVTFDRRMGKFIVTDRSGKIVTNNAKQLAAAADILRTDYSNPETERGAFASYSEMGVEDLENKINKYLNVFSQGTEKSFGGRKQYVASGYNTRGKTASTTSSRTASASTGLVTIKYKTHLPSSTNKTISKIGAAVDSFFKSKDGIFDKSPMMHVANMYSSWIKGSKQVDDKNITSLDIIKQYEGVAHELIKNRKFSDKYGAKAVRGDKEAQDIIADLIREYLQETSEQKANENIYVGDYLNTEFGKKMKNSPLKAGQDVAKYMLSAYNIDNRSSLLDKEDLIELEQALKTGKASVKGVLPAGSDLTRDSNGDYVKDLSQSYVIKYEGEQYLVPRIWEPKQSRDPNVSKIGYNYHMNRDIEEYTTKVPIGVQAPIFFMGDDGKPVKAIYYHDPVKQRNRGEGSEDPKSITVLDKEGKEVETYSFESAFGRLIPPTTFYQGK